MRFVQLIVLLAILSGGTGAGASTLYDDLGGKPGVAAIISDSIDAAVVDPRVADKFSNINIPRLKGRFAELICQLTGGPCQFHGVSMKGAHAQLELHDRHFNAVVEDLENAMDKAGVPYHTQNRLLAILAPLHRDIVTK